MRISRRCVFFIVASLGLAIPDFSFGQQIKVLTNHIGYEENGAKCAVILGHPGDRVTSFKIVDLRSGNQVASGVPAEAGPVDHAPVDVGWPVEPG